MQRALVCAALAEGRSELSNPSYCADAAAALGIVEALGSVCERGEGFLSVRGGILAPSSSLARAGAAPGEGAGEPPFRLSCGESGLLMRMFAPIAALSPGAVELVGEGSLASRPVSMMTGPLAALGVSCATNGGLPPVRLRGPLRGGRATVDASSSSQFLTGLLMALPLAAKDSVLDVPRIVSRGYIDLTMETMRAFGVAVERSGDYSRFEIPGGQSYRPTHFEVEGDWSGGAFLLVAGAIAAEKGLVVEGLPASSAQPDRAVIEALSSAGARLSQGDNSVSVSRASLRAFDFDATDCPDLFPPLVALAAACCGVSTLRGAARLRNKESDRASSLAEGFLSLGVPVEVEGDLMRVRGGKIRGGAVDAHNDHRIAMAAAVAALASSEGVEIEGPECVKKSWPEFFEDLDSIARCSP
jgi:3-phosphoshikimate 1-carboxyvinyltransferase